MYSKTTGRTSPLARQFSTLELLRFAIPSIGMMLVVSLYTITDGIFIGRFAGSTALAASNIIYPVLNLVLGLSIMLAAGSSALVTKNLGERHHLLARRRFTMIVLASIAIPSFLGVLTLLFESPILAFLGASEALLPDCRDYLHALLPFFPISGPMFVFNAFYIADGRPTQGFLVSVIAGVTNAVLDYIFLAHLHMGIFGAGLATGIADLAAVLYGFYYFSRRARSLRFAKPVFSLPVLLHAMGNGSSELVTQLSVGITTFLFNIITFQFAGEAGVAAISVILYAEMLLTAVYIGFTNGAAPIFSFHYGREDYAAIARLAKKSLKIIAASAALTFGAAQIFAAPLISLFLPEGGTVYELTVTGFLLFSFSCLFCGFNFFISGFFTALSDGKTSALVSFARNLAGISIFLLTLPQLFGIKGAWIAVPVADITALLLSGTLLISRLRALLDVPSYRISRNAESNS